MSTRPPFYSSTPLTFALHEYATPKKGETPEKMFMQTSN